MQNEQEKLELNNPTIHQKNENCQVFNGPISGCVFAMPGATVNQHSVQSTAVSDREKQEEPFPELPTDEEMNVAVVETVKQGLWWSSRSWAVVYRVYQIKGYMKGFTQFVRDVESWKVKTGFECNYDAVQKPISSGIYAGTPDKWATNGAQKQAISLANTLLDLLDKTNKKQE